MDNAYYIMWSFQTDRKDLANVGFKFCTSK